MKNIIEVLQWKIWHSALFFILLLFSCSDNDNKAESALFAIDCDNSSVEGSFVQNVETSVLNVFNLVYKGGGGASARIWANEVNGLYIEETDIALDLNGSQQLQIKGKPIEEGEFTIKITVAIGDKQYYCSQIFGVYKDEDPTAPIIFTMDDEYLEINGLIEPVEIPFTVDPSMSSIQVVEPVVGLNFSRVVDKKTGEGKITLTPSDEFTSGDLMIAISFGNREEIFVVIKTTTFLGGNGKDKPYEIDSPTLLKKMSALPDKNFILTKDIDLESKAWSPIGTEEKPFLGTLNGNGRKISNINVVGNENSALFAFTGVSAQIENLTISGQVKGTKIVAGLVANNLGKISNVNAEEVKVEGEDFIAGVAAKNAGTITSSSPIEVLEFTGFPSMISEINTTVNMTLKYKPIEAVAVITVEPENLMASIAGNVLTLTPNSGFVKSEMELVISYNKLTSLPKKIQLFAEEQFDDGDGENSPFVISKASQLSKMRNYPDKKFILAADIDIKDLDPTWTPIPAFSGTLDGAGFKIENLKFEEVENKGGIFLVNTGTIKNLILPDIDLKVTKAFGVLVGENSGVIDNIVITGKLTSTNTGDLLGGVVAEALKGEISNVYANLDITTSCGMVGTIVGRARSNTSTITNCTAKGTITLSASKSRVAGIVGRGETGVIIKNCLSSVIFNSTTSGFNGVGGIFGANNNDGMKIEECMFDGQIKNAFMTGGIAGVGANITNCIVEGLGADLTVSTINVGGGTINTSSGGGVVGTGKATVRNNIVRNTSITGVSSATLPLSGISSTFQNNGFVSNSVVYNVLISGTTKHAIAGTAGNGGGINSQNYAANIVYQDPAYTSVDDANGLDGGIKQTSDLTQSFFESLGFDFTTVWKWVGGEPQLRNVGYKGSLPTK